jgi:hypothetical protein
MIKQVHLISIIECLQIYCIIINNTSSRDITDHWKVNYPSFIWNLLVGELWSINITTTWFFFEEEPNIIYFCLFFKIFQKCCITSSLNRLILLFTTAILGVPLLCKSLCFFTNLDQSLFEFQVIRARNRSKFEGQLCIHIHISLWECRRLV